MHLLQEHYHRISFRTCISKPSNNDTLRGWFYLLSQSKKSHQSCHNDLNIPGHTSHTEQEQKFLLLVQVALKEPIARKRLSSEAREFSDWSGGSMLYFQPFRGLDGRYEVHCCKREIHTPLWITCWELKAFATLHATNSSRVITDAAREGKQTPSSMRRNVYTQTLTGTFRVLVKWKEVSFIMLFLKAQRLTSMDGGELILCTILMALLRLNDFDPII